MKKLLIFSTLLLTATGMMAQDYISDAGRMMQTDLSGTARSLGAGGAFSTVGADMSSMSSNPAGIALYRSHEFAVSGGGIWGGNNSTYQGQPSSASFSKATLSQAGFIFASRKLSRYDNLSYNRGGSKLDRVVIGIGYQKLADFNSVQYFSGSNSSSSYAQSMAAELNGNQSALINQSNFSPTTVNGYNAGVLAYPNDSSAILNSRMGLPINQQGMVTTQGAMSELNFTMGFNIGNTVYIGAGLGVPYINYHRYATFSEYNNGGDSSYTSHYDYSLSGWGVNGKLGIIVKPIQWLRIGAAIQTPTVYRLNEHDNGYTFSNFGDSAYGAQSNLNYQFTYNNPLKGTFGASVYLKQWGFLSVDYELNDYGHTRFLFDGGDQSQSNYLNNTISNTYRLASTVKAGAEFAYKGLRLRAGFAWSQSPFNNTGTAPASYNGARFNYTAGIGYRGRVFFADLAYVRTEYKNYYTPYSYTDAQGVLQNPGVYNTFSANTIIATIGFKFGTHRN
jgi:hypothetical protein